MTRNAARNPIITFRLPRDVFQTSGDQAHDKDKGNFELGEIGDRVLSLREEETKTEIDLLPKKKRLNPLRINTKKKHQSNYN